MDVGAALSKVIPRWEASPTRADAERFKTFVEGLGKADYVAMLSLLPGRLTHHREAIIKDESAWYDYVQAVCLVAIVSFDRFVPGTKILTMLHSTTGVGRDLGSLWLMLSEANRKRIPGELLHREAAVTNAQLEEHFRWYRIGIVDYAVELMIERLHRVIGKKQAEILVGLRPVGDNQLNHSQQHEYELLRAVQALRLRNPARLPQSLSSAEHIRFLVEETSRHLFAYSTTNERVAVELISRVWQWYGTSKVFANTRRNVAIYLVETGFFANLREVGAKIQLGATYEPHWNYYIKVPLRSDKFWDDIAGLNENVDIMSTEAGRRQKLYQQAVVVGAAVFVAMALVPVIIRVAMAVPGIVIRLVVWVGRTMYIAARYVHTTIRIYGFFGGLVRMARDGFEFYMQNPVLVNQKMLDLTEIVLDVFTDGIGMAPNASHADQLRLATERAAVMGEKGLKLLADDAAQLLKDPGHEVQFVRLIVKDVEGKEFEIIGRVRAAGPGQIKLVDLEKSILSGGLDDSARRSITFIGNPAKEAPPIQDLRGTLDTAAAGKQAADAARIEAKAEGIAARTAANDNVVTQGLDDLAKQRQKVAQEAERLAQEKAQNLAQRQALLERGDRIAADGSGAQGAQMGRQRSSGRADVGSVSPATGGGSGGKPTRASRGAAAADSAKSDKATLDTGKGAAAAGVPARQAVELRGVVKSPAGYLVVVDESALVSLEKAGYTLKKTGVKAPNSGGAKFQIAVTGVEHEWKLTSPGGSKAGAVLEAEVDALALDPDVPNGFIFLEVKAMFVEDLGKSAHVRFYPEKVKQLGRQLMICLGSKGKLRMEIVTNVPQAAEAYLNMTAQQVARQLRTQFASELRDYFSNLKGSPVSRLSMEAVEKLVEDNVNIVVSGWPKTK